MTQPAAPSERAVREFPFAIDPRYSRPLALLGVRGPSASVHLSATRLDVRFGPWRVTTPLENVLDVQRTGPYQWYRVIGPHVSLADRGLSFGTNTEAGACIRFREAVRGVEPLGVLRHPGLTVTVADVDGFVNELGGRLGTLGGAG